MPLDLARQRLAQALETQRLVLTHTAMREADDLLTASIAMVECGEAAGLLTETAATKWKRKLYVAVMLGGRDRPPDRIIDSLGVPAMFEYITTYAFGPDAALGDYALMSIESFSSFFALRWASRLHGPSSSHSRLIQISIDGTEHENVAAFASSYAKGTPRGETLFIPGIEDIKPVLQVEVVGPDRLSHTCTVRRP